MKPDQVPAPYLAALHDARREVCAASLHAGRDLSLGEVFAVIGPFAGVL